MIRTINSVSPKGDYPCQLASIVFYHDETQRELAVKTKEQQEAKRGTTFTEIVPAVTFYSAEAYHQKYRLQRSGLMQEFSAMYPSHDDFVASTAAARVNGYLGSNGTCEQLREELDSLGLTPAGQDELERAVCSGR